MIDCNARQFAFGPIRARVANVHVFHLARGDLVKKAHCLRIFRQDFFNAEFVGVVETMDLVKTGVLIGANHLEWLMRLPQSYPFSRQVPSERQVSEQLVHRLALYRAFLSVVTFLLA